MLLRGPVLVATDGTPPAAIALREAAGLARALDARLIVCHVLPGSLLDAVWAPNANARDAAVASAGAVVRDQVNAALAGAADAPVEVVIESGAPDTALLRQAAQVDASVIVIEPGPLALSLARQAPTVVLVSRAALPGPVVGATDFSDPSLPALHLAISEARRRAAPLHLLHALDASHFSLGRTHAPASALPHLAGSSPIALDGLDALRAAALDRLRQTRLDAGVSGEVAVVPGKAADVVVRYAESVGAELVVIGTHGRTGLRRLTLGRTAGSIIESAPCSVMVAPLRTP